MGAYKNLATDETDPALWTLRTVLAAIATAESQSEYEDLIKTRDELFDLLGVERKE